MNEYKNQISILRNILQKSNDRDLIDYVFKKILPEIFDFYIENYINLLCNLLLHNKLQ